MNDHQASLSIRLDIWLWRARFFKTRRLSAEAIESGAVRLMRHNVTTRITKPSQAVKAGDRLILVKSGQLIDLEIKDTGERRGPSHEALSLYCLSDVEKSHQNQIEP